MRRFKAMTAMLDKEFLLKRMKESLPNCYQNSVNLLADSNKMMGKVELLNEIIKIIEDGAADYVAKEEEKEAAPLEETNNKILPFEKNKKKKRKSAKFNK
jgi:hypothetical protein